jgi:hypothetical protein
MAGEPYWDRTTSGRDSSTRINLKDTIPYIKFK